MAASNLQLPDFGVDNKLYTAHSYIYPLTMSFDHTPWPDRSSTASYGLATSMYIVHVHVYISQGTVVPCI